MVYGVAQMGSTTFWQLPFLAKVSLIEEDIEPSGTFQLL
jgi:hypothetical protein